MAWSPSPFPWAARERVPPGGEAAEAGPGLLAAAAAAGALSIPPGADGGPPLARRLGTSWHRLAPLAEG